MQKGICHISQIPLRGEPRSSAEQVSQLLFGETYAVLKQEGDWCFIQMDFDGYQGWISLSSTCWYAKEEQRFVQTDLYLSPNNDLYDAPLTASMGSEILETESSEKNHKLYVGDVAKKFLGTPYSWGGRHHSGIDCSGLVQIVYKTLGMSLPRDASEQQRKGKPIRFKDVFEGDLIFFYTNERVTHVGIALGRQKIVHAHGMVRIDTLTTEGIRNAATGQLTHRYHSAKRLR